MISPLKNISLVVCVLLSIQAHAFAAGRPSNIILILSDDVGAETVGVYGGESYQTPQLDRLANDGVRFDYGHAQPLCTPSRVKIMTGQHNFRNYTHFEYLDSAETTFAHILKDAGYSTMVAGKWQLYSNPFEDVRGSMPAEAGFDDFRLWQMTHQQRGSRYWGPLLNTNGELQQYDADQYGPDLLNDYVLDYIEAHRTVPFFIYYPMVLAHDPWVTTPDMRDESVSDQDKFSAMMTYMDKLVGKVRDKVEEAGIAEDTLILFIGDNGTGRGIVSRQNGVDVAGAKSKTIDAGTRVPFMAWGAGVGSGGVSDSLVNLNDILPTLAEAAGVALPFDYPADGESLGNVLAGNGELDRDSIFIHYEPRWLSGRSDRYAFDRQYKLYEEGDFYDMLEDPLEKNALDVDHLEGLSQQAYLKLDARITSMPGELDFPRRWIPWQIFALGTGVILVLGFGIYLIGRLIVYLRR
ncbi:MAG: sulfatase-like hydrolase/transferase [Halioglobus sp.]